MKPARRGGTAAASFAAVAVAGCAATGAPPASPLAGTEWRLVAVESMADEQPTARPADPARYTIAFGRDRRAGMQLDCNRGTAAWQAGPPASDTPGRLSGSLEFGPLAVTHALCPPESLEPRLAKSLPFVRSYLLVDGRLHLSLMADGGILTWEPVPAAVPSPPIDAGANRVRQRGDKAP